MSAELTSVINKLYSRLERENVCIEDLEWISSTQVMWICYENVSCCCCQCIVCFRINYVFLWSESYFSHVHGYLYLTAIAACKFGKGTYCVYPNGGCADNRGSGTDDGNDDIPLKL